MTRLCIQPFGGFAGDIFLASLLDLEDPRFTLSDLRAFCETLVPGEFTLGASRTKRGSIEALHLDVRTPETAHPPHRHLADLLELTEGADLSERARARVHDALRAIGEAEAKVHGVTIDDVHFHEVGAVDTIIDVCGAAFALEKLEVDELCATPPYVGGGTVDCAHGTMPVPVPAVVELMQGRAMVRDTAGGERLTPTGAAILARWTTEMPGASPFAAERHGYGAGTRDPKHGPPNLASVALASSSPSIAAPASSDAVDTLREYAVNLDDATGEELGHLLDGLRDAGAIDAWCAPVQMKKGRPGVVVSWLAPASAEADLARVVFGRSPTLGLRSHAVTRVECARAFLDVDLDGDRVRVKQRVRPAWATEGAGYDLSPEYDDLAAIARRTGASLRELEARAIDAARDQLRR